MGKRGPQTRLSDIHEPKPSVSSLKVFMSPDQKAALLDELRNCNGVKRALDSLGISWRAYANTKADDAEFRSDLAVAAEVPYDQMKQLCYAKSIEDMDVDRMLQLVAEHNKARRLDRDRRDRKADRDADRERADRAEGQGGGPKKVDLSRLTREQVKALADIFASASVDEGGDDAPPGEPA